MKILKSNTYKENTLKHFRIFFINTVAFKYNGERLFKSHVASKYYTTELYKVTKP